MTASAISYQTTVLKQMRLELGLASDNNLVKATNLTHSEIIMTSDMKKSHPKGSYIKILFLATEPVQFPELSSTQVYTNSQKIDKKGS